MEQYRERNGAFGWLIVAVLLISVGSLGFFATNNAHVVSNAEYLQLSAQEKLNVTSEDTYLVANTGGLGVIIAGFITLAIAIYMRLFG